MQGALQEALGAVADHPVELTAAGRTDAGVHALVQVAHFDTHVPQRPIRGWVLGGTAAAADDITILWALRGAGSLPCAPHARCRAPTATAS